MDTAMIGVEHWQVAGLLGHEQNLPRRFLGLTLQWVAKADFPPVTVALTTEQAREIGEALISYADTIEQRNIGEQN